MSIRGQSFGGGLAGAWVRVSAAASPTLLAAGFTMAGLVRTTQARWGILSSALGGAAGVGYGMDGGLLFGNNDVSNGFGTSLTDGIWRWILITKPAGSAHYRWHVGVLATAVWQHGESVNSGNHPDAGGTIDEIYLGAWLADATGLGFETGDAAAFAVWDHDISLGGLNDGAVEAACTLAASDLAAASPTHGWLLQESAVGGAGSVVDFTGNGANEDARQFIIASADPPNFDFTIEPTPPNPPEPPMIINLTLPNFVGIVTGVGACINAGLAQTPAGAPDRFCPLVPSQVIPWDSCDCGGQLALAIQQMYGSDSFLQPFVSQTWAKCKPRWWVAQVVASITRCVPTLSDTGQPPDCADELAAAVTLANDMTAARQAIACCLTALYDARQIGAWTLGISTTVGELGGCAGSETTFWIGVQACPCPG